MEIAGVDPQERLAAARKEFGEWGGVNASIEVSTTFTVLDAATMPAIFTGRLSPDQGSCYVYGRSFNPTVRYLGRQLAAMEGTEAGYACSSGIAAISSTLLTLCNSGDHIVASSAVYGGTHALLKNFLPTKAGIHTTFVNIADLDAVAAAITPRTKVLYTETLSNPTLVVANLPRLAAIAHERGVQLVVDNTFTPLIISPARWGADVVIHSLTKFISGASDIIAGAVCGPSSLILQMMDLQMGPLMLLGPTMDPKVASELSMRIPHLAVRMAEHSARALAFASRLHHLGAKVSYPGLPSHPQHELLKQLVNPGYGFGGILGLDMGSQHLAEQLMERLQNQHGFGLMAVSLGYFDSLLSCSAASTSSELSPTDLASAGIEPAYVRISVGLTGSLEQRWLQLQEAYLHVASVGALLPLHFNKQAPFAGLADAAAGNSSSDSDCTAKHPPSGPSPTPPASQPPHTNTRPTMLNPGSNSAAPQTTAPPPAHDSRLPATTIATTLPGVHQYTAEALPAAASNGAMCSQLASAPAPAPAMTATLPRISSTAGAGLQEGAGTVRNGQVADWHGHGGASGVEGQGCGSDDDGTPLSKRARVAAGGGLHYSGSFNSMCAIQPPLPQQQQEQVQQEALE